MKVLSFYRGGISKISLLLVFSFLLSFGVSGQVSEPEIDRRPALSDEVNITVNVSTDNLENVLLNLTDDSGAKVLSNVEMVNDTVNPEQYYYSYEGEGNSVEGLWRAKVGANSTSVADSSNFTRFYVLSVGWFNTSYSYRHNISSELNNELFGPLNGESGINEGFDSQDHFVYGTWRGENGEFLDAYHMGTSGGGWNKTIVANSTSQYCAFQTLPLNYSNCENRPDGLAGYWTLDESGSKAQDYIGGYDGNVASSVTQGTDGKVGNAYDFTGNAGTESGGVDIRNPSELQLDKNLTISMWVNPDDLGAQRENPIDKAYGGEFAFTFEDGGGSGPVGSLSTYFGSSGSESGPYATNRWDNVASNDQWTHIVWVRDTAAQDVYLYKNGQDWSSQQISDEWETPSKSSEPVKIGTGYANNFDGQVDGVRIYNRTLSLQEASALYNQSELGGKESISEPPVSVRSIETDPEPVEETETVNITVNASDIGEALENATINLTDAEGNLEVENGMMNNDSSVTGQFYYEYTPASESSNPGTWDIKVKASNVLGYSDSKSSTFEVVENDKVRPEWRRLNDDAGESLIKGQTARITVEALDNISGMDKVVLATNHSFKERNEERNEHWIAGTDNPAISKYNGTWNQLDSKVSAPDQPIQSSDDNGDKVFIGSDNSQFTVWNNLQFDKYNSSSTPFNGDIDAVGAKSGKALLGTDKPGLIEFDTDTESFNHREGLNPNSLGFYKDGSTDNLKLAYPNGTINDLDVQPEIVGNPANLDSDDLVELPFIDASGNLKIVDRKGQVNTLTSGLSTQKVVIGTGKWKNSESYVFYPDSSDNSFIKRNRKGFTEETVAGGIASNGVLGTGDFDGDGDKDLLFLGTSDTVKWRDDGTTYSTGFSSFGSNNNKGVGGADDFNGDGKVEVPHVTGSNNLALLDNNGNQNILDTNYQAAAKTRVAGVDYKGNATKEIIHVDSSGKLAISYMNGTTELVEDQAGNPISARKTIGASGGEDLTAKLTWDVNSITPTEGLSYDFIVVTSSSVFSYGSNLQDLTPDLSVSGRLTASAHNGTHIMVANEGGYVGLWDGSSWKDITSRFGFNSSGGPINSVAHGKRGTGQEIWLLGGDNSRIESMSETGTTQDLTGSLPGSWSIKSIKNSKGEKEFFVSGENGNLQKYDENGLTDLSPPTFSNEIQTVEFLDLPTPSKFENYTKKYGSPEEFEGEVDQWKEADFIWSDEDYSGTLAYKAWIKDLSGNWQDTAVGKLSVQDTAWFNDSMEFRHRITSTVDPGVIGPINGTEPVNESLDSQDHYIYGTLKGTSGEDIHAYHQGNVSGDGWNSTQIANSTSEYCSFQTQPENYSRCTDTPPELLGYWTLDRNDSKAVDYVGGNDGTISGSSLEQAQNGYVGRAFDFNGGNDVVTTKNFNPDTFTAAAWVNWDGDTSETGSGDNQIIINEESQYEIGVDAGDGTLEYAIDVGQGWSWIDTGYNVPQDEWVHVAFQSDGSEFRVYVNGTLQDTTTQSGTLIEDSSPLRIGARPLGDGFNFNGTIDEVRLYDQAVSSSRIESIYSLNASLEKETEIDIPPPLSSWFNETWTYRKPHDVNNTVDQSLENFQIKLELDSTNVGPNFNWTADRNASRFTKYNPKADSETELSYWVENWDAAQEEATVWINVTEIPESTVDNGLGNGVVRIYHYYGNIAAEPASNGTDTFGIFDDFEGSSLKTDRWYDINSGQGTITVANSELTISSSGDIWNDNDTSRYLSSKKSIQRDYIAEALMGETGDSGYNRFLGLRNNRSTQSSMFFQLVDSSVDWTTNVYRDSYGASADWYGDSTGVNSVADDRIARFTRVGDTVNSTYAGTLANSRTVSNWNLTDVSLTATKGSGTDSTFDWVRTRKHVSTRPSKESLEEQSITSLAVDIDRPEDFTRKVRTQDFTMNGTVDCSGDCGDVNVSAQYQTQESPTREWKEETQGDFISYNRSENISITGGTLKLSTDYLDPWWNTSWPYRYRMNLSKQGSRDLKDVQKKLEINSTDVGPNFDWTTDRNSSRFIWYNQSSGDSVEMDYWIEGWNATAQNASVWVEVPRIEADTDAKILHYYGNSGAESRSDPQDTFLFFDDFEGNSLNTTKWVQKNTGAGTLSVKDSVLTINSSTGDIWNNDDTARYIVSDKDLPENYTAETFVVEPGNDENDRFFGIRSGSRTDAKMYTQLVDAQVDDISVVYRTGVGDSAGYLGDGARNGAEANTTSRFNRVGDNVEAIYGDDRFDSRTISGLDKVFLTSRDGSPSPAKFDWIRVMKYKDANIEKETATEQELNLSSSGTYYSNVFDTGKAGTKLKNIYWAAKRPENTTLRIFTRSSSDNSTWGPWLLEANNTEVFAEDARYVQYKVEMETDLDYETPLVSSNFINYEASTIGFEDMQSSGTSFTANNPYECGELVSSGCNVSWSVTPKQVGRFFLRFTADGNGSTRYSDKQDIEVYAETFVTDLVSNVSKVGRGRNVQFNARLKNDLNNPLEDYSVRFNDTSQKGELDIVSTNATGWATLNYRVPEDASLGEHTIRAAFDGSGSDYLLESNKTLDIEYASSPSVGNLTAQPNTTGLGTNTTLQADVSDTTGLDEVTASVDLPNGSTLYYDMKPQSGDRYAVNFSETWDRGIYDFEVTTNNTEGVTSKSDSNAFAVNASLKTRIKTQNESYDINKDVQISNSYNQTRKTGIFNNGSTKVRGYLAMYVINKEGTFIIPQVVNDRASDNIRTLDPGERLNISQIWRDEGAWNTDEYPPGSYKVHVELEDPEGDILESFTGETVDEDVFLIENATLNLSGLEHENRYEHTVNEYEVGDTIDFVNVSVEASNNTALDANATLDIEQADWGPDSTKQYGDIPVGTVKEEDWTNSSSGYIVPHDANTGTYNYLWNVSMKAENAGQRFYNDSESFTIINNVDTFESAIDNPNNKIIRNESVKYNFTFTNRWSQQIENVNVSINCDESQLKCRQMGGNNQKVELGSVSSGATKTIDYNVSTNRTTTTKDYDINVTVEYLNPDERRVWEGYGEKLLSVRNPGALLSITDYPVNLTRTVEGNFSGYVNNTYTQNLDNTRFNWTIPSSWNLVSGNLSELEAIHSPGEVIPANITLEPQIDSSIGETKIKINTTNDQNREDKEILKVNLFANTSSTASVTDPTPARREQTTIRADVTLDNGTAASGITVDFYDETEGTYLGSDTTNSSGKAALTYQIDGGAQLGQHNLNATFNGSLSEYYRGSSGETTIEVDRKPTISNIDDSPDPVGFNYNVSVSANVTDSNGVSDVDLLLKYPNSTETVYNMENVNTTFYEYNFSDTYNEGNYSYLINATDSTGSTNESLQYRFEMDFRGNITSETKKDEYSPNQNVTLNVSNSFVNSTYKTGFKGYLVGTVEEKNSGVWEKVDTVINDSATGTQRSIGDFGSLNISNIWNTDPFNVGKRDPGTYRVNLKMVGPDGKTLNASNTLLNTTDRFNITAGNVLTDISQISVYDVSNNPNNRIYTSEKIDSGENISIQLEDGGQYRTEIKVDVLPSSSQSWNLDENVNLSHGGLDSSWSVSDIWYSNSSDRTDTRFETGTFNGEVEWDTSNNETVAPGGTLTLYYVFSPTVSTNKDYSVETRVSDPSFIENQLDKYELVIKESTPPYIVNDNYYLSKNDIVRGNTFDIFGQWNETLDKAVTEYSSTSPTLVNDTVSLPSPNPGNWSNYTFSTSSIWSRGDHKAKLYSKDKNDNWNSTLQYLNFEIFGKAEITDTYKKQDWFDSSKDYRRGIENVSSPGIFGPLNGTDPVDTGLDSQKHWIYGTLQGDSGQSIDAYYEDGSGEGWNSTLVADGESEYCSVQTLPVNSTNCPNPPEGLVSIWSLDESGSKAWDHIGENHGTIGAGATQSTSGPIGNSYSFDGSNPAVNAGNPSELQITGDMTVSFWMKPNTISSQRMNPVDKAYGGEFAFTLEDGSASPQAGSLSTYFGSTGAETGPQANNVWSDVANAGEWVHVTWTRDVSSQTVKLYVNGTDWEGNRTSTEWRTPSTSSEPVTIGGGYANTFDGKVDNVRIYNRVLSQNEAQSLYSMNQDLGARDSENEKELGCKVEDSTINSGINNYDVNFYNQSSKLGTVQTNSTGWSSIFYNDQSLGTETVTCNITESQSRHYKTGNDEETFTLNKGEFQAPKYFEVSQNLSEVNKSDAVKFSTRWKDNFELDSAVLETNITGSFKNESVIGLTSTNDWANFSYSIPDSKVPGSYRWKQYGNDTSANYNSTPRNTLDVYAEADIQDAHLTDNRITTVENTSMKCKVGEYSSSNGISGYTVNFYNSTGQIGTETTKSDGYAKYEFNDTTTGEETITCNITASGAPSSFYKLRDSSGNDTLNTTSEGSDTEPPSIANDNYFLSKSTLNKGTDTQQTIYGQWTESINKSTVEYNWTQSLVQETISEPYTANWTNTTLNVNSSWSVGKHHAKLYANDQAGNRNETLELLNYTVRGRSEVRYLEPSGDVKKKTDTLKCRVKDYDTGSGLVNYSVDFYDSSNFLGSSETNATGHATLQNDFSGYSTGSEQLSCAISSENYYDAEIQTDSETVNIVEITNYNAKIEEVWFSNQDPVEEETVEITVNVTNNETTKIQDLETRLEVYDYNGSKYSLDDTYLKTKDIPGEGSANISFTWTAEPGSYSMKFAADPNDKVNETVETDNKLSTNYSVSSHELFYGSTSEKVKLSDKNNYSIISWLSEDTEGTLYFSDSDIGFSTSDLLPLNGKGDLGEADEALNLTGHNDSLSNLFDSNGDGSADKTGCLQVSGSGLCDVPLINSTNSSSFRTGVLYDSSDGSPFDGSQNLIFATEINSSKQGMYGNYDYEVKVPYSLGRQEPTKQELKIYQEIG